MPEYNSNYLFPHGAQYAVASVNEHSALYTRKKYDDGTVCSQSRSATQPRAHDSLSMRDNAPSPDIYVFVAGTL
jgi:hypothetical protein